MKKTARNWACRLKWHLKVTPGILNMQQLPLQFCGKKQANISKVHPNSKSNKTATKHSQRTKRRQVPKLSVKWSSQRPESRFSPASQEIPICSKPITQWSAKHQCVSSCLVLHFFSILCSWNQLRRFRSSQSNDLTWWRYLLWVPRKLHLPNQARSTIEFRLFLPR